MGDVTLEEFLSDENLVFMKSLKSVLGTENLIQSENEEEEK